MKNPEALQNLYAPDNACFGCGPANPKGLRLQSVVNGKEVHAEWTPDKHHEAFDGVLNGGIIGALLDCHCNWTAAWHLMQRRWQDVPPCTVTAEYAIKLMRPTPTDRLLRLRAWVIESSNTRALVSGELTADDKVCATCRGTFVAVKPGHPGYHRW